MAGSGGSGRSPGTGAGASTPGAGAPARGGDGRPHVVIVGSGFGGLHAARSLGKAPVRVTLVDRHNHHLFQPLLYQVATAALAAPDVAEPIRKMFRRQENLTVILAEATAVDPEGRRVILTDGEISFDYLILAAGSENDYFGHDEWAGIAPGLKDLDDAFEIRRRILLAFEEAERERDAGARRALLNFVVVGAGPTGVELAGAIQEIAQRTLAKDFRNFDPRDARVVLIDGNDRVLESFPERLSREARRLLEARGVQVITGSRVTQVEPDGVEVEGDRIPTRTVLWAAGVKPSPLARFPGARNDEQGRVLVGPDLSVPGHPSIFVVGDLAAGKTKEGGWVPGMAPAAIQEGRHAARCILLSLEGKSTVPFRYADRGMLATIGRSAAVARIGPIHLSGLVAWLLWLSVHIAWLVGFRNRVIVLLEWAWAYVTYQRSARVIIQKPVAREEARDGAAAAGRPARAVGGPSAPAGHGSPSMKEGGSK